MNFEDTSNKNMPKLLSTGIPILDNILGGGLPAGSMVCFMADPMSMAEVFLYQFASVTNTYYFAADRNPSQVNKNISSLGFNTDKISFRDIYSRFNYHNHEGDDNYPSMSQNINNISYLSAIKSTNLFLESVNLPQDIFWKFEFWTEEKVIEVLGNLFNKVFAQMMQTNDENAFSIISADAQKMEFVIKFDGCNECENLRDHKNGVCYYHAGMCAGILSSLLKKEFGAYESECCAKGDESCIFVIGLQNNEDIQSNIDKYLSPEFESVADEALLNMEQYLDSIESKGEREFAVIIDSFSFFLELSNDRDYLRKLLNSIYEMTSKTDALSYLYVFKDAHEKSLENMILNKADVVFNIELETIGNDINNILSVLKIRGMSVPSKRIKVNISDRVTIDTSTVIA